MKHLRLIGIIIGILCAFTVVADDIVVGFKQIELRIPSPYTITSTSPMDITIELNDNSSSLSIRAVPTEELLPTQMAEDMNASRTTAIEYKKVSLSGVPALVSTDAVGYAHMLVVWQGMGYDINYSALDEQNPFLEETGTKWDDIIAGMVFIPAEESPVFIQFETDSEELQSVPNEVSVRWELINRPDNSNLEFVQILSDGQAVNVELPRTEPFISSSGEGLVNIATVEDDTDFVDLQVRLFDLSDERLIAVSQILLPVNIPPSIVPTPIATAVSSTASSSGDIVLFDSEIDLAAQTTTVTWILTADTVEEVRYQSIGANGQSIVEFLPTQSSGSYVFSGNFEKNEGNNLATLAVSISGTQSVASTEINFADDERPQITIFQATDGNIQVNALPAQASVTWEVINRPPNANLEFVQVLPNDTFINAELPRPNPIIASTGSGMVNLVASDTFDLTQSIDLIIRVRLVDADGNILTSRDAVVPYHPK